MFLAGLFALTMYVMLQTLEEHKPTWQDRLTTPGAVTPETACVATHKPPCQHGPELPAVSLSFTGMVIRPKADDTFEIVYDIQKTESWDMYAQALDKFLARKSDSLVAVGQKKKEAHCYASSCVLKEIVLFLSFFYFLPKKSSSF